MLLALLLAAAPILFPTPVQSPSANWRAAACTGYEGTQVCKFATNAEKANDMIVVERADRHRVEWPVATWVSTVNDFVVLQTDLDGDGRAELIVANRASEANGVAVRSWQIAIVDGTRDAATHFVSQDWGPDSLSGTTLLVTEWEVVLPKATFVGREYAYKNGHLEATKDPVRRRALTPAFETERRASTELIRTPRKFLSHDSTVKQATDAQAATRQDAVVRGLTLDEPWLDMHLERSNGVIESLSTLPEDGPMLRLADAKNRRLYPLGYAPEDSEAWLLGKKVSVGLDGDKASGLIWVSPP